MRHDDDRIVLLEILQKLLYAERCVGVECRGGLIQKEHLGLDSQHDYDPLWRKCRELGIAPTFHTGGRSYGERNSPTNFTFNFKDDRVDPLGTISYDVSQDINVYFTYDTGFRAGGANDRSQTFTAFGQESVKSYEIGAKTEWFDNRVRLNLAGSREPLDVA